MFTFYFMFTLSTSTGKLLDVSTEVSFKYLTRILTQDLSYLQVFFLTYNFDQAPVDTIPLPYLQLKLIERTSERTQRLMNYLLSAFSVVKINKLRKIVYIRVI